MSCCGKLLRRAPQGKMALNMANIEDTLYSASDIKAIIEREEANRCRPRKRPDPRGCCLSLGPNDQVHYPDPAIYSQREQLELGNIPDWDNPDITTNNWGPFHLMAESIVVVHNLSPTVGSVNTLVHFSISPFGIGMPRSLIATKQVSIPPASNVQLLYPLPQSILQGDQRIGVYIHIEHPGGDMNYQNNDGEQVHDGSYTTESGRNFTLAIPVYNNSNFSREIILSVMPTDIIASISPASHIFNPHEQIVATLHIDTPGFLTGSASSIVERAVTVVGRLSSGEIVGGATKLMRINN